MRAILKELGAPHCFNSIKNGLTTAFLTFECVFETQVPEVLLRFIPFIPRCEGVSLKTEKKYCDVGQCIVSYCLYL